MKLLIFFGFIALAQADLSKFWPNEGRSLKGFPEFAPRIVGGTNATDNEFPYQVAIKGADGLFCGGAIYNVKNIVTAASCVDGLTTVQVVAGKLRVHNEQGVPATVTVHTGYNSYTREKNIALVHPNTPLVPSAAIVPIPIDTQTNLDGKSATITGWGSYSDSSNALSTILIYASETIITNTVCKNFFSDKMLKDENVCLNGANFKSSCTGDIGGPLVIEDAGVKKLAGIASFGSSWGCQTGSPFVYTRAATYAQWINDNLVPSP